MKKYVADPAYGPAQPSRPKGVAHEVCTADLLCNAQYKSDAGCQDQPFHGTRRIVLSQPKVGGHEGKAGGGVTCRKAVTAAAVTHPQVPVRHVGRRPAKCLKVPWTACLTKALDQSHRQQRA